MSQKFQLTIASRVENLARIGEFVEQAARACGLNERAWCDVEMAVDEACANVIEHAYHDDRAGRIDLRIERKGKDFVVVIEDYGKRFDPQKIAKPNTAAPLSERNVGGLGVYFIHKLMDRVKFDSSSGHNVLTMVKKIES